MAGRSGRPSTILFDASSCFSEGTQCRKLGFEVVVEVGVEGVCINVGALVGGSSLGDVVLPLFGTPVAPLDGLLAGFPDIDEPLELETLQRAGR